MYTQDKFCKSRQASQTGSRDMNKRHQTGLMSHHDTINNDWNKNSKAVQPNQNT